MRTRERHATLLPDSSPPEQLALLSGGTGVYLLTLEGRFLLWLVEGDGLPIGQPSIRLPDGRSPPAERRRTGWRFDLGPARPADVWLAWEVGEIEHGELVALPRGRCQDAAGGGVLS